MYLEGGFKRGKRGLVHESPEATLSVLCVHLCSPVYAVTHGIRRLMNGFGRILNAQRTEALQGGEVWQFEESDLHDSIWRHREKAAQPSILDRKTRSTFSFPRCLLPCCYPKPHAFSEVKGMQLASL